MATSPERQLEIARDDMTSLQREIQSLLKAYPELLPEWTTWLKIQVAALYAMNPEFHAAVLEALNKVANRE